MSALVDEDDEQSHHDEEPPRHQRDWSLLRDVIKAGPSMVLENTGSVARDHLASERTFLAWVRTSLAIASTGVALVQLFTVSATASGTINAQLQKFARPLGATTICLGIVVLLIGIWRYFMTQSFLTRGQFPAARRVVIFVSTALALLIAIVFGVLASVSRQDD